jgi:hypothetical protein
VCVCACVCVLHWTFKKTVQWRVLMNTVCRPSGYIKRGQFLYQPLFYSLLEDDCTPCSACQKAKSTTGACCVQNSKDSLIPSLSIVLDNFSLYSQSVSSLCHHYTRFITNAILCNDFCLRHCNWWHVRAVHGTVHQEPRLFGEKV